MKLAVIWHINEERSVVFTWQKERTILFLQPCVPSSVWKLQFNPQQGLRQLNSYHYQQSARQMPSLDFFFFFLPFSTGTVTALQAGVRKVYDHQYIQISCPGLCRIYFWSVILLIITHLFNFLITNNSRIHCIKFPKQV